MKQQLTNNILMVIPNSFGFNPLTSSTNPAQKSINLPREEILKIASDEYNNMVITLRSCGINVYELYQPFNNELCDAVFPNNWFTTYEDGTLILFPMFAKNRRMERNLDLLKSILINNGFIIKNLIDLTNYENQNIFLEGTGSLILDRIYNAAFASKSERTNERLFNIYCDLMKVNPDNKIFFECLTHDDLVPPYHTNIVMSIGKGFAVICTEYIHPNYIEKILSKLKELNLKIINITKKQCKEFYCGNVLNVKNNDNESLIIMSNRAYIGFEVEQLNILKNFGDIISVDLKLIEDIGGGSARCMMAEIFLPKI